MKVPFRRILCLVVSSAALNAGALSNSAQVPVLLYHSGIVGNPCDYGSVAATALAADLETFHNRGITVVLYWKTPRLRHPSILSAGTVEKPRKGNGRK